MCSIAHTRRSVQPFHRDGEIDREKVGGGTDDRKSTISSLERATASTATRKPR